MTWPARGCYGTACVLVLVEESNSEVKLNSQFL
jgi:hypothetical protein